MPFILIVLGIMLLVVGFRGTQDDFLTLLKGDFTGSGNFIFWIVSIVVIGMIGYVPKLKGLSDAFLTLVILVLFLSHGGFFAQFNTAIRSATSAAA